MLVALFLIRLLSGAAFVYLYSLPPGSWCAACSIGQLSAVLDSLLHALSSCFN